MFSVVIPLYNKAPYIKRAINSILNQTYQEFEIIIVNDGSTDGSGEIVSNISDPRIRLFHQENLGVSEARNRGIKESPSDFIAFLDADDEWRDEHLEAINHLIYYYPNCGAFATSFSYSEKSVLPQPMSFNNFPPGWQGVITAKDYFTIKHPIFNSSSICLNKNILNRLGGFNVGFSLSEDLIMWIQIALNYPIAYINKDTAIYHIEASNRSNNSFNPDNPYKYLLKILDEKIKVNSSELKPYLIDYANSLLVAWAKELFVQGHYEEYNKIVRTLYPSKSIKGKKNIVTFLRSIPKPVFLLLGKSYRFFKQRNNAIYLTIIL